MCKYAESLLDAIIEKHHEEYCQKYSERMEMEMDKIERNIAYRKVRYEFNDLLVAMMADILKLDQLDNAAAAQRIRVNSIKFKKVSLMFRKLSIETEKNKIRKKDVYGSNYKMSSVQK